MISIGTRTGSRLFSFEELAKALNLKSETTIGFYIKSLLDKRILKMVAKGKYQFNIERNRKH